MSELKVLIADDEPLARRGLEQLLAAHPDCVIVAKCRNGRETVRALRTLQPDAAILDIQMPGLDGFEVLNALSLEHPPVVVFATAYDEFAVRAFEAHALDYLLKPISQQRFDVALARIRERLRARDALRITDRLAAFLGGAATAPARNGRAVIVTTGPVELVLNADEIHWIEAEDYYAAVHALGKRHLVRESLSSLERRLDPHYFVRVHRSAIVPLHRIRELKESPGGWVVVLRDGTEIPVSRRRRERVRELLRSQ